MNLCPRCKSQNVSTLSMIYQSGSSAGSFKAISYGLNAGVIGTGGKTKNQTYLAQSAAPPKMPQLQTADWLFAFFIGAVAFWVIADATGTPAAGAVAFVIGLFGFIGFRFYLIEQAKQKWKVKIKEWESTWMCLACGASFQVQMK